MTLIDRRCYKLRIHIKAGFGSLGGFRGLDFLIGGETNFAKFRRFRLPIGFGFARNIKFKVGYLLPNYFPKRESIENVALYLVIMIHHCFNLSQRFILHAALKKNSSNVQYVPLIMYFIHNIYH